MREAAILLARRAHAMFKQPLYVRARKAYLHQSIFKWKNRENIFLGKVSRTIGRVRANAASVYDGDICSERLLVNVCEKISQIAFAESNYRGASVKHYRGF